MTVAKINVMGNEIVVAESDPSSPAGIVAVVTSPAGTEAVVTSPLE